MRIHRARGCVALLALLVAPCSQAATNPLIACGVAYTKLQVTFTSQAVRLGAALCKDQAQFNTLAAALVAKTNLQINNFNVRYSAVGCDSDITFPVAPKSPADVTLALQNALGAVPLDKYCNGEDDSPVACGNAEKEPGEQCDLSDLAGQSCGSLGEGTGTLACAPDCQSFDSSGCSGICGDGQTDAGEQCDDGNTSDSDACLSSCQASTCGDGFIHTGVEQCDDSNSSNSDACLNSCQASMCGDGFVRVGVEQCDDGNAISGDGCSFCQVDLP